MKKMKLSTKLVIALVVILLGLLLAQAIVSNQSIKKQKTEWKIEK